MMYFISSIQPRIVVIQTLVIISLIIYFNHMPDGTYIITILNLRVVASDFIVFQPFIGSIPYLGVKCEIPQQ